MNPATVVDSIAGEMCKNALAFWKSNCIGRDEFRAKVEAYWEVAIALKIEMAVELVLQDKIKAATVNVPYGGTHPWENQVMHVHGIRISCPRVDRCVEEGCDELVTNTYRNFCKAHEHLVY